MIVPTYCPGDGLDRLVGSLDRQTLPAGEFEVIFIDDGSPDDTFERLQALSATHPNHVVRRIENSGWPSRPRNVGLGLARGEYVLFMDHDDYLYPEALRAGHAFAVEQRADVVSGKETRTSDWFAYEAVFQRDVCADEPKTPGRYGQWTTHKLFRRAFLLEHDIRFREGNRALFEDVLVGISAYVHADRIAVLASQPFYQWVHTPGANYSATYGRDVGEYLNAIRSMMDQAEAEAPGTPFAAWMRGYQYRMRVLGQLLGPGLLARSDEVRPEVVQRVHAFMDEHVPASFDDGLNNVLAARAHLARSGDVEGVVSLAEADRGVTPLPIATSVEWDEDGALHVGVEVRWQDGSKQPLRLRRDGARLLRELPAPGPQLPDDLLDFTDAVARATAHLTVTDAAKTGWPAVSAAPVTTVEELAAGDVTPVTRFDAVVHRAGSELGRPLAAGLWSLACRASLSGYSGHRVIGFDRAARIRGEGGAVSTAHAAAGTQLAMRLEGDASTVMYFCDIEPRRAHVSGRHGATMLHMPVRGAQFAGVAAFPVTAVFRSSDGGGPQIRGEGRLVVDHQDPSLELPVRLPQGRYRMEVQVHGRNRPLEPSLELKVTRLGRTSIAKQRSRDRTPALVAGSAVSYAKKAVRAGLRRARSAASAAGRRWADRRQ